MRRAEVGVAEPVVARAARRRGVGPAWGRAGMKRGAGEVGGSKKGRAREERSEVRVVGVGERLRSRSGVGLVRSGKSVGLG